MKVTRVLEGVAAVPGLLSLGILRAGPHAEDTLANDVGVAGFVLTKAS